jgi:putative transposase
VDKFKGRYRIPSARLEYWDYGGNGAYFVTLCTQWRAHYFGRIKNGQMIYSPVGQAAKDSWFKIVDHFPFVRLGAFVVMPNHVHGIIIVDKTDESISDGVASGIDMPHKSIGPETASSVLVPFTPSGNGAHGGVPPATIPFTASVRGAPGDVAPATIPFTASVETQNLASLRSSTPPRWSPSPPSPIANRPHNQFGPQSKNLASIVRGYKIGVTLFARRYNLSFGWQPRYHDHVIRNPEEFARIEHYIRCNPQKWVSDRFNG